MDIEKLHCVIECELGNVKSKAFSNTDMTIFRKSYKKIKKNIEELEVGEEYTEYNIDEIHDTVRILKGILIRFPVDKPFVEFTNAWVFLVFNWNNNTYKNTALEQDALFAERLVNSYISMNETIEILRHMNKLMMDYQSWQPPAFSINKAFLDHLE